MIKKGVVFIVLICFLPCFIHSFEFGVIAGVISKPSSFVYGLSGGMGFIVPMMKFEVELYKITDTPNDVLSGGIKFRPKLGKLSPYAVIGVGTEFVKFDFESKNYEWFTFIGGGIHLKITGPATVRFDIRYLNFSNLSKVRFSGGIFIHL